MNRLLSRIRPEWLTDIRANAVECEALRPRTHKPAKTGTISEAACLYLRAVVEAAQPKVCVEIGTFIGTSALVLASAGAHVYTCDKDNDVFKSTDRITAFGKTTSTDMLRILTDSQHAYGVVDFWFFDGRIQLEDLPAICQLSHPKTIFAFDDYEGEEKGVINVGRLRPRLPGGYVLVLPPAGLGLACVTGTTTIALLVPASRL